MIYRGHTCVDDLCNITSEKLQEYPTSDNVFVDKRY